MNVLWNKKLNGWTMLESLVAMVVMMVLFTLAMKYFSQFFLNASKQKKMNALEWIEQDYMEGIASHQWQSDQLTQNNLTMTKLVQIDDSGAVELKYEVLDEQGRKVLNKTMYYWNE